MRAGRADVAALVREARAAIEIGNPGAVPLLLHRAEGLAPTPADWRAIGDAWHAAARPVEGGKAHLRAARASARDRELVAARAALDAGKLDEAGLVLTARLDAHPSDTVALRLRAELASRLGNRDGAEAFLRRALTLAPDDPEAQTALAALTG